MCISIFPKSLAKTGLSLTRSLCSFSSFGGKAPVCRGLKAECCHVTAIAIQHTHTYREPHMDPLGLGQGTMHSNTHAVGLGQFWRQGKWRLNWSWLNSKSCVYFCNTHINCVNNCLKHEISSMYMFPSKHLPHEVWIGHACICTVCGITCLSTRDTSRQFYKMILLVSLKASCTWRFD